jgi:hypothetical protein
MKPISPKDAVTQKRHSLPDYVIQAFNEIIGEHLNAHGSSTFRQEKVVDRIAELHFKVTGEKLVRQEVFNKHWLDVEPLFEDAGWRVTYDKPAYNETYPATFTFRDKKEIKC